MKVPLGHLDGEMGAKGPPGDPADKTFLGLHIVSNVSKWSNLLSLAPALFVFKY